MDLYDPQRETDAVFTGIIQQMGRVISITPGEFAARLAIDSNGWGHRPALGDSIAVNGCCLTETGNIAGDGRGILHFDVVQQTLSITTLGSLRAGDPVNLEHAVTPQTLLGGHIVQGHVDGVGEVIAVKADASEHRVRISPPEALMDFIIEKGSIAVDGVSLTIAAIGREWVEVALIPTTLELTTLGRLQSGSRVNLEADYLVKIVVNQLRRNQGRCS